MAYGGGNNGFLIIIR